MIVTQIFSEIVLIFSVQNFHVKDKIGKSRENDLLYYFSLLDTLATEVTIKRLEI